MTMDDFAYAVGKDLKTELAISDENFDEVLLKTKVQNAIREVLHELGYSPLANSEKVVDELSMYYTNIRNIALYDYNTIGAEFSSQISESSVSRHYTDRNKLFAGIIPKAKTSKGTIASATSGNNSSNSLGGLNNVNGNTSVNPNMSGNWEMIDFSKDW